MTTPRTNAPRVQATALDIDGQVQLRAAIKALGLYAVAERCGLSYGTVCGIASGCGCHDSSKKLVRLFLAELVAEAA